MKLNQISNILNLYVFIIHINFWIEEYPGNSRINKPFSSKALAHTLYTYTQMCTHPKALYLLSAWVFPLPYEEVITIFNMRSFHVKLDKIKRLRQFVDSKLRRRIGRSRGNQSKRVFLRNRIEPPRILYVVYVCVCFLVCSIQYTCGINFANLPRTDKETRFLWTPVKTTERVTRDKWDFRYVFANTIVTLS